MITAMTVVGTDVCRDWPDGFGFPGERRFRVANSAEGHEQLIAKIREMPGTVKVGFEATGGQEWGLWASLVAAGIEATQLPPAQIKAFALSRGTRAKTDRIDAELIARFMPFRPEAGRRLPSENLRILRALQRLETRGKPHELVIVAIARGLITIANAILKTGVPWQPRLCA